MSGVSDTSPFGGGLSPFKPSSPSPAPSTERRTTSSGRRAADHVHQRRSTAQGGASMLPVGLNLGLELGAGL